MILSCDLSTETCSLIIVLTAGCCGALPSCACVSCGCGIVSWLSVEVGVDDCWSASPDVVSWPLGAAAMCVCGSDTNPKVGDFGDCGDTVSCVFREMGDPVRSCVGEAVGVGGE